MFVDTRVCSNILRKFVQVAKKSARCRAVAQISSSYPGFIRSYSIRGPAVRGSRLSFYCSTRDEQHIGGSVKVDLNTQQRVVK